MKLCTFKIGEGAPRPGIARDGLAFDITHCIRVLKTDLVRLEERDFSSVIEMLKAGAAALDLLRKLEEACLDNLEELKSHKAALDESEVCLLAPLPRPNSIRDCLLFEEHMINSMETVAGWYFPPAKWLNSLLRRKAGISLLKPSRAWYNLPVYYKGNPDTVVGPGAEILWPSYTKKLDYELEFGFYILGSGKNIKASKAKDYIAGYTLFNDFSARDIQMKEMSGRLGPTKGKDFDTSNAMGPYLVTPDEVGDPYSLKLEAHVNGQLWSSNVSRGMNFSFEELIEYVSQDETLHAGEFFGSGTVGGGCGLELNRWLQPGDEITLKADKLGELRNKIRRG